MSDDLVERPPTFEERCRVSVWSALEEADRYFGRQGEVHRTLRAVASRLDGLNIPYAIVGAVAMFAHGFRRFTHDVDVPVAAEGWDTVRRELVDHGYSRVGSVGDRLRDTATGVRVDFLITGDYPGDGQPKPLSFPDPAAVSQSIDGISYVNLPALVELKVAAGLTKLVLMRHLGDAVELFKVLQLPLELGEKLHPYVREKYAELWSAIANDLVKE